MSLSEAWPFIIIVTCWTVAGLCGLASALYRNRRDEW